MQSVEILSVELKDELSQSENPQVVSNPDKKQDFHGPSQPRPAHSPVSPLSWPLMTEIHFACSKS